MTVKSVANRRVQGNGRLARPARSRLPEAALVETDVRHATQQLAAGVRSRLEEMGQRIWERIRSVDGTGFDDPIYAEGTRTAIATALEHAVELLELQGEESPAVPATLLAEGRRAARRGVGLDAVLRRYFAGFTLYCDLMREVAESVSTDDSLLRELVQDQAAHLDEVMAAVSQAYMSEMSQWSLSSERRRVEKVERLLDGRSSDANDLAYTFQGFHLAAIAIAPDPSRTLEELTATIDRMLCVVEPDEEVAWGWLGGQREFEEEELQGLAVRTRGSNAILAIGEPAEGLTGWRLSHRQARAALPFARQSAERFARYSEIAILAALSRDDLLLDSLPQLYLARLDDGPPDGATARETLRAYFAAECNVSSAAAALGVNRHTVASRLRAVEQRLGRPLSSCRLELDAALRLEETGGHYAANSCGS